MEELERECVMASKCGPLTPPLAHKGAQGYAKRPADNVRPQTKTKSLPMRPQGGTPSGHPSATPRAKSGR